jgi:hypothetical protein
MKVKFYMHTKNHRKVQAKLEDVEHNLDYEKTDLGYVGDINGDSVNNEELLSICDSISKHMVSLLIVFLRNDGMANGVGYKYENGKRKRERDSKGNNPNTWHGIVYDSMHLDASDLQDAT